MKKNFLTKIAMIGALFIGAFAITSCQSTNQSEARFIYDQEYTVFEGSDRYTSKVVIGVENPTIYNIKQFTFTYRITGADESGAVVTHDAINVCDNILIYHGASGYFGGDVYVTKNKAKTEWGMSKVNFIKITSVDNIQFQGVWDTYLGWWIACFIILGVSVIFYAAALFKKNLSIEAAKNMLHAHIASSMVTLLFVLLICLFPLIFSGWVVTVMLLGTFLAGFLITFLLTALKSKIGYHDPTAGNNNNNPQKPLQ